MKYLSLLTLLVLIISLGLNSLVYAQDGETAEITIDPQKTSVQVSTDFKIKIWITGLEEPYPMVEFQYIILWDQSLLEWKGYLVNSIPGWPIDNTMGETIDGRKYLIFHGKADSDAFYMTEENYWHTLTFHCLGSGSAQISIVSEFVVGSTTYTTYIDHEGGSYATTFNNGAVNQYEIAPVAGILSPISKLAILTPYIALVVLITAVSTVYVFKRRKD